MPKDRTAEFLRIRREIGYDEEARIGGNQRDNDDNAKISKKRHGEFGENGDGDVQMALLRNYGDELPFFQQIDEAWKLITQLIEDVNHIRKLHSFILSSPNPDEQNNQELQECMTTIQKSSLEIRTKLKEIHEEVSKREREEIIASSPKSTSAHLRIIQTQHSALLRLFVETTHGYHRDQSDYRDRGKNRIYRQLEINQSSCSEDDVDRIIDEGSWSIFTQGIFRDRTTEQAREMLADLEARHRDLIKLETSIRELHDMFMEMAFLIESHGEVLDGIEIQVVSTQDHVHAGTEQIQESKNYQNSMKKKQIYLAVILSIVIAIILVVFLIIYFIS